MQEEQPEFGRFKPKGDIPKEPREPFFPDEMLEPSYKPESPTMKGLHFPKAPLTKKKLMTFLIEFKPIASAIQELSRNDQHLLAMQLQDIKNLLHAGDFQAEIVKTFEKIADHFNELLVHSRPVDQEAVSNAITQLEAFLT